MTDQESAKKRWTDKALVVGIFAGVIATVVGIYGWLWITVFSPTCKLTGMQSLAPEDLTKLGQMGDSFGVLTCLFAAIAFALSWMTNRSQGEELKLQRELSEKQLRMASEAAYAQRLQSLRAESEMYVIPRSTPS